MPRRANERLTRLARRIASSSYEGVIKESESCAISHFILDRANRGWWVRSVFAILWVEFMFI